MLNIYTLIPLLFLLIASYYFNKQKLDESTPYILMVSTFEGVISFFIVRIIFLEGFFTKFYQYLLVFLLIAIISYIFFLIERDLDNDMDLQMETIKNNIILFAITIAPFYFFLTIFRFEGPILQIVFSLLATSVITGIYIVLRELLNYFSESIYYFFSEATPNIFLGIWAIAILIVGLVVLFDLPINTIRENINLSDNVSYFTFDGYPIDLQNRFEKEQTLQIEIPEFFGHNLIDYYIDNDTLYVYSSDDYLYVVDIPNEELIYKKQLGVVSENGRVSFNEVTNLFFTEENQLYILSRSGLHQIDANDTEMISPLKATNAKLFYHEDTHYLLQSSGVGSYHVYMIDKGAVVLSETILLEDDHNDQSLTVISKTLFKVNSDIYTHYYHHDYTFTNINSSPLYDHVNNLMYYAVYQEAERSTIYHQIDSNNTLLTKEFSRRHNTYGTISNGYVFYAEAPEDSMGRLEIINQDFEVDSIINHREHTKFWIGNQYYYSYIVNYVEIDGHLTYLQTEQNRNNTLLTLEVIKQRDTGLDLPFYSYYGLVNFLPIIFFLFVPMSNYRTEITFLGFDQLLKKKK